MPRETERAGRFELWLLPLLLTILTAGIHIAFLLRVGEQDFPPLHDQAGYHLRAFQFAEAIRGFDVAGIAALFSTKAELYDPLSLFIASLFRVALGDSRLADLGVNLLATFLTLLGVRILGERIAGRATARLATLLLLGFPVWLVHGRTLLLEYPLTATITLALVALLASEGFSRTKPALLFGLLFGLALLSRKGAAAFFVAPVLHALAVGIARGPVLANILRAAAAGGIAAALAAIWILPNYTILRDYIRTAAFTEGGASFRYGGYVASLGFYAQTLLAANVTPQILVPPLLLHVFGRARAHGAGTAPLRHRWFLSVSIVGAILLVVAAGQIVSHRMLLPLTPLLAVGLAALLGRLPAGLRRIGTLVVAVPVIFNVALVAFPPERALIASAGGFPMFAFGDPFLEELRLSGIEDPRAHRLSLDPLVDAIRPFDAAPDAPVVYSNDPLIRGQSLAYAAAGRGLRSRPLDLFEFEFGAGRTAGKILRASAVVIAECGGSGIPVGFPPAAARAFLESEPEIFERAGTEIRLGRARADVYRNRAAGFAERIGDLDERRQVAFVTWPGGRVGFLSANAVTARPWHVVIVCEAALATPAATGLTFGLAVLDDAGRVRRVAAIRSPREPVLRPGLAPGRYRMTLEGPPPEPAGPGVPLRLGLTFMSGAAKCRVQVPGASGDAGVLELPERVPGTGR